MLLRLTCPTCGRVEQASERVLGKEVRCPCGTQFRVLQPKKPASGGGATEPRRPQPAGQSHAAPRQSEAGARPAGSRSLREQPHQVRARPGIPLEPERAPEQPVPWRPRQQANEGMPPWAYAALGAGGVVSLVLMILVIRAAIGSASQLREPDRATNELAAVTDPAPGRTVAENAPPLMDSAPLPEPTPVRTATRTSGATLSTAEIVARCEPSVALIKGKVSTGTGFVIKRGIVATNAHVIEDELLSGLEIRFPSAPSGRQGPLPAQLLYEDRKRDVAFLAVATDLPALELAANYAFQKGEDVIVIGNPGLGDEVVLENAISRGVMSAKTVIEGMNYFQMSIAINPGNSGGPVFDSSGRVIGVATLKANKAEAMGFCIPVEELKVASRELVRPHPEVIARHRAVATFNALTLAGAIYVAGIVAHAGQLGAPPEDLEKLHETVRNLDEKLFSQVDSEVSGLQNDSALSPRARRNYQELSANYKAMKQVYGYPTQQVNQYAKHVQDLRKQHYNLVVSIRDELQVEVPAKLLAILQEPTGGNQPQIVVVEMMPQQMQPGFRRRGPGVGPRGPGATNPGAAMHNQMMRQMETQRRQMQNRLRNLRPPGVP
jgi:S1-C subfamily serine protease